MRHRNLRAACGQQRPEVRSWCQPDGADHSDALRDRHYQSTLLSSNVAGVGSGLAAERNTQPAGPEEQRLRESALSERVEPASRGWPPGYRLNRRETQIPRDVHPSPRSLTDLRILPPLTTSSHPRAAANNKGWTD